MNSLHLFESPLATPAEEYVYIYIYIYIGLFDIASSDLYACL